MLDKQYSKCIRKYIWEQNISDVILVKALNLWEMRYIFQQENMICWNMLILDWYESWVFKWKLSVLQGVSVSYTYVELQKHCFVNDSNVSKFLNSPFSFDSSNLFYLNAFY